MTKTAPHLGEELSGTVEQVADLARSAGKKLDEARYETADALAGAACSVRTTGRQGSEAIDDLANSAASKLDSTAAYVRRHDTSDMLGDLQQLVRRHPASFLVGAAVVGFFLGSAGRRK
jgi:ElaB/YqjD/DUF883 family membrane-anchored ribosome-binding protein